MLDGTQNGILARLQSTLDRASLPDRLRASGQALAERLASPVRLSFMGRPGVGKSTLIQALIGDQLPGLGDSAPTYELVYGETPRTLVTLEDGTRQSITGADLKPAFDLDPMFAEIHTPCDRLRNLRMLELVTDGTKEEMMAAVPWAANRCDIPIWCTRGFDAAEARIWANVPNAKKNHAMLVLTQADRVPSDQMTRMLEDVLGTDGVGFCIIAPVASRHALQAQIAGRDDAEKVVKASGVAALRHEILRRVELGRQVDLDHAELLLDRFETRATRKPTALRLVGDEATQEGVPSQSLAEGAEFLRDQAREMLIDIEEFGAFAPSKIVERCLDAANTLVDLIADDAPSSAPQALAHTAATDAADMLLLMTLENTAGAAEDAVNLMLQVQREFALAA